MNESNQELRPRIRQGKTFLDIPNNGKYITFVSPAVGPNNYLNNAKQLRKSDLTLPNGYNSALLLEASYFPEDDAPEFQDVRQKMKNNWLNVYERVLWTLEGAYVVDDSEGEGLSVALKVGDLEKSLEGSSEIKGVRFSKDKKIRFAPRDRIKLGEQSAEDLADEGLTIATYMPEGAEKLSKVSTNLRNKPSVYGISAKDCKTPIQRVSALLDYVFDGGRLVVGGLDFDGGDDGCAFGVSDSAEGA